MPTNDKQLLRWADGVGGVTCRTSAAAQARVARGSMGR